jgi:hypothetical protein
MRCRPTCQLCATTWQGALVQRLGSFSEAMIVNGLFIIAAGLLMLGLAAYERWQARRLARQAAADSGGGGAVVQPAAVVKEVELPLPALSR